MQYLEAGFLNVDVCYNGNQRPRARKWGDRGMGKQGGAKNEVSQQQSVQTEG